MISRESKSKSRLLSETKAGQVVRLISVRGVESLQGRLASLGLVPGALIEVVSIFAGGPFIVAVKGSRLALGRGMAQQIEIG
jgi:Fe2+ transport system protein FeoA